MQLADLCSTILKDATEAHYQQQISVPPHSEIATEAETTILKMQQNLAISWISVPPISEIPTEAETAILKMQQWLTTSGSLYPPNSENATKTRDQRISIPPNSENATEVYDPEEFARGSPLKSSGMKACPWPATACGMRSGMTTGRRKHATESGS
ncbi:unnamed protein product [Sphagnum jensenii]|jgi:hypothetical protein|uniref:Uncharacterized protein n=1 Tax=Sphagnum jensenii TaxID=128206 RepID=A0ABP0WCJ6_9BRYO